MDKNGKKIGIALSGGGYRAAAYHLGTLRALHTLGVLDKVDVISSVSGGSIASAYFALHKDNFKEFERTFRCKLRIGVLWSVLTILLCELAAILFFHAKLLCWVLGNETLNDCCKITILIGASILILILIALLLHKILPTSCLIDKIYKLQFFGFKKLSDLPNSPICTINATDVEKNRQISLSQLKVSNAEANKNFKNGEIPISLAVMASSAYPMFSPVQIPKRYLVNPKSKSPILVDGGIYDNQGAHKLTEKADYHTDYIIVSDAGNTEMNRKGTWNVVSLMRKVINMMMNRIDKMQRRDYLYMRDVYDVKDEDSYPHYAYAVLEWMPIKEDFVKRFVENVSKGHVAKSVCERHGINEDLVARIKKKDDDAWEIAKKNVEEHIGWKELYARQPEEKIIRRAQGVWTGLWGLRKCKIEALIQCAEWMTEVQIKLYMPEFLPNDKADC